MGSVAHATISEPVSVHCVNECSASIRVSKAREIIPTALSTWTNGWFADIAEVRYAGRSICSCVVVVCCSKGIKGQQAVTAEIIDIFFKVNLTGLTTKSSTLGAIDPRHVVHWSGWPKRRALAIYFCQLTHADLFKCPIAILSPYEGCWC